MQGFPGCIGAIDGTHIPIISPGGENPEIYRNRKGFFSINCQVVAGPRKEITSACVQWAGSVHDSRIFENSNIKQYMSTLANVHLIGDSGYPCRPYLLTPFRVPHGAAQNRYNFSLSSTRMSVECCFGILKRRFACLSIPLRSNLNTSLSIIVSCFVLHNIAIFQDDLWENLEIEVIPEAAILPQDHNAMGNARRNQIVNEYFSV